MPPLPPPPPAQRPSPRVESVPDSPVAMVVSKGSAAVAQPGLQNETGEYNCFLNVIIQCLWHCSDFRTRLLSWPPHYEHGKPALVFPPPARNARSDRLHPSICGSQRAGVEEMHHFLLVWLCCQPHPALGAQLLMCGICDAQRTGRWRRCSRSSGSLRRTSGRATRRTRTRWLSEPSSIPLSCAGRWLCRTRRTSK